MAVEYTPVNNGVVVYASWDDIGIVNLLKDACKKGEFIPIQGLPWTKDFPEVRSWVVMEAKVSGGLVANTQWRFDLRPVEYVEEPVAPKSPEIGQIWVADGKLYELQPDGSARCWMDPPPSSSSVEERVLTEELTCDVAKYQEVEAYINNVPLKEWLDETHAEFIDWFNDHSHSPQNDPSTPLPVIPFCDNLWRWSQGLSVSQGSPSFEKVKEDAEKFALLTEPVQITLSSRGTTRERMEFGWDARNKLVPVSQLNALPRLR